MKLIKINTDHYVVVDDDDGTRTHSTIDIKGVLPLSLQEVKELIGEVDVETKVEKYTSHDMFWYKQGYNQALEDNKEKKYTEDDMIDAIIYGSSLTTSNVKLYAHNYINSLNKQD
jgi:hypothetical protein